MNRFRQKINNPAFLVLLVSLILIITNIYIAQQTRPYTSDDVSWQNILATWTPFNGHIADMGVKDNFIINMPLLAFFGWFLHPGRTLLFIEASVFAIVNFVLFFIAGLYFLRKCKVEVSFVTLMPFIWLASFGYNFALLYMNTNWRDFEIGLSFIYFMLAIKLYYGELNPFKSWTSKLVTVCVGGLTGILIYSDPYFLYLTVLPVALMFIALYVLKKTSKEKVLLVLGGLVFGVVIDRVLKSLMARVGLFTPHGTAVSLIPIGHLVHETADSLSELSTIFGANISGDRLISLPVIAALLNLVLVFAVMIWAIAFVVTHYRGRVRAATNRPGPLVLLAAFFGALFVLVFVANVLNAQDDYRYFVLSIYLIGIMTALCIGTLKKRGTFFFVLIWLTSCINIATSVFAYTPLQKSDSASNYANVANYQLIQTMHQYGLSKGYTNYWDGNINTYLSNGKISFLPVTCAGGTVTQPLYLLVDTNLFNQPANRSFYIVNQSQTTPPTCPEPQVESQFGKPVQILSVSGEDVLIYNYDIGIKMQAH